MYENNSSINNSLKNIERLLKKKKKKNKKKIKVWLFLFFFKILIFLKMVFIILNFVLKIIIKWYLFIFEFIFF